MQKSTQKQIGLVNWKNKKQSIIASSAEAEYRAMANGTCKVLWIKISLKKKSISSGSSDEIIWRQSRSFNINQSPIYHERTKHIDVGCHFTWEMVNTPILFDKFVRIGRHIFNLITKCLGQNKLLMLLSKLGIMDTHALA